jgi:FAD/FMN-containing dehydrogenase
VEREVDGEKVFDLTQLIAGSQGTLGIITEITLWTIPKPKFSGLLLAFFDSFIKSGKATQILLEFEPSALEMVDHFLLEFIQKQKPEILSEIISDKIPEIVLLCEFDADEIEEIEDKLNKAKNSISDLSFKIFSTMDSAEQARFWAMRRSALVVIEESSKDKKALPFIEDVVVPSEKFPEYVSSLYEILKKYNVEFAVWGHAGDGNIHVQPFLDLGEPNDREKIFNIADEVFNVVVKLGGVFSGEHNDGIMRTPYLSKLYPAELLEVWKEVKRIFDPLGIFNPGKKIGCNLDYAKAHLREEYEVGPAKPKSSKSA